MLPVCGLGRGEGLTFPSPSGPRQRTRFQNADRKLKLRRSLLNPTPRLHSSSFLWFIFRLYLGFGSDKVIATRNYDGASG